MRPPDKIENRFSKPPKQDDEVWLWNGYNYVHRVYIRKHDFKAAVTVRDGNGDQIVSMAELISNDTHEAEHERDITERLRLKNGNLIKEWESGVHDRQLLAKQFRLREKQIEARLKKLIYYGLITDDQPA